MPDLLKWRERGVVASFLVVALGSALLPLVTQAPAGAQTYALGIDVSHHQEEIDWSQVAESGQSFVWAKATEGATFADPRYLENRTGAATVGIPFGAYHFAYPQGATRDAALADAISEASYFLQVAQPQAGDLLPVLDLEANPQAMPPARLIAWTQAWLDTVTASVGVKPMIYTGPNFWANNLDDTATFASQGFPLWIAHYTSEAAPNVPAGNWGGHGWAFWQFTSSATVPGISGPVDQNRYPGSDLTAYTIPGAPEPTPSPTPVEDTTPPAPPRITQPRRARVLAEELVVRWSEPEADLLYDVRYRSAGRDGDLGRFRRIASGSSDVSMSIGAEPGTTYCFSARAMDQAGNRSSWSSESCALSPLDDRDLNRSRGWSTASGAVFYRDTFTKTARRGASLVIGRARMRSIHVLAQRCPGCGKVQVLLNGRRVGTVSLDASGIRNRSMLHVASFSRAREGKVKLVVVSDDMPVKIDGLALTIKI